MIKEKINLWLKLAKRKENIAKVILAVSFVLESAFPHDSKWNRVGYLVGLFLMGLGYRRGYQANNLSKFETDVLDKVPNTLTGIKGSKK